MVRRELGKYVFINSLQLCGHNPQTHSYEQMEPVEAPIAFQGGNDK